MQTTYPEATFERYNLFDIHTCNWNRRVLTKEYEKTETKTTIVTHIGLQIFKVVVRLCRVKHTFTKPCFFRVKANETMWLDLNFGYMRFNLHLRFNCLHIEIYYIYIYIISRQVISLFSFVATLCNTKRLGNFVTYICR